MGGEKRSSTTTVRVRPEGKYLSIVDGERDDWMEENFVVEDASNCSRKPLQL
jgi:hypothetical protein